MITAHTHYYLSFFCEGRFLGSGVCPPLNRWGTPRLHNHTAYYCPDCGEVWARIVVEHVGASWYFQPRPCKKHGPPFLLQYNEPGWNNAAPINVWAREFLIAMEWTRVGRNYETYLVCGGMGRLGPGD